METHFRPLTDGAGVEPLLKRSHAVPVILFLHAPKCWISWRAYREMAQLGQEITLIDVEQDKQLCRAIEQLTGVRHESPQVILLRQGHAVWSASHSTIKEQTVAAALRTYA